MSSCVGVGNSDPLCSLDLLYDALSPSHTDADTYPVSIGTGRLSDTVPLNLNRHVPSKTGRVTWLPITIGLSVCHVIHTTFILSLNVLLLKRQVSSLGISLIDDCHECMTSFAFFHLSFPPLHLIYD